MALTRVQSVYTYKTASGGREYYYDVVVDAQSLVSVRNIRGPRGLVQDSMTSLPTEVVRDIEEAVAIAQILMTETEVASGTVTFSGQTSRSVVVAGGLLNNTNYRVLYSTSDGTYLRTEDKTTTGFTAVAPAEYGSEDEPIDVTYSVLVAAAQGSAYAGVLTFSQEDGGVKQVTFPTAQSSSKYRVHLSPSDFFPVKVGAKTKTGFSVFLGYSLADGEQVTVGYDVFV